MTDEPKVGYEDGPGASPRKGAARYNVIQRGRILGEWTPALAPSVRAQGWRPISEAPRDGTRIVAWCVHANAKYDDDPVASGWEGPVVAYWIEHNGGGWTWHGHTGAFTHWMPLPPPPEE